MRALEAPRHACHACGACCRGTRVRLVDADEVTRIEAAAATLGVDRPVVDGRLRHGDDGACVFLGADALCDLHRRFGAAAKPDLCRQYPFAVNETEAGARVGVDPGCFSLVHTWRGGDAPADDTPLVPNRSAWDPVTARAEAAVVALLGQPGLGVVTALAWLVGAAPDAGMPTGLVGRLVQRVGEAGLGALLRRPDTGSAVRGALLPVVEAAEGWERTNLPELALDAEMDAFAVAMVRRQVYNRLCTTLPVAQPVAVLGLCGAVLCGLHDPRPDAFGPALAAWLRALRAPPFWRALTPEPATLIWLATGQPPR